MHTHLFPSMVLAFLLLATQLACGAPPRLQPAATPAPLALPHELLRVEEGDLTVTLTLVDGDDGRKDIAWSIDSTSMGPGYEVALHQGTLRGGSEVRSWAEAEKLSPNRSTSRMRSPGREPGRQGMGKTMLQKARPGERVAVFLELKMELAGENGTSAEIGTTRGPVILEPTGAGWALVKPTGTTSQSGSSVSVAVHAAPQAASGLALATSSLPAPPFSGPAEPAGE